MQQQPGRSSTAGLNRFSGNSLMGNTPLLMGGLPLLQPQTQNSGDLAKSISQLSALFSLPSHTSSHNGSLHNLLLDQTF
jgi:hypothetical protein